MPAYFATAFAFEISIVVRAYSIGNISGRHVNPEVSLGVINSIQEDKRTGFHWLCYCPAFRCYFIELLAEAYNK